MVIFLALIYVLVLLASAQFFAKREGYYSTPVFFGFSALFYYIAIPVQLYVTGLEEISLGSEYAPFPATIQAQVVAMGTLALFAFVLGYWSSGFNPYPEGLLASAPDNPLNINSATRRIPVSIVVLATSAFGLLLVGYRDQIAASGSYSGNYETNYLNPLYSILTQYVALSLAICAGILVQRRPVPRAIVLCCVGPILLWGMYSSDKNPIFLAALGMATYFSGPSSRNPRTLLMIGVSVVIIAMTLPAFSLYRARVPASEFGEFYTLNLAGMDPAGPMYTLVDTIHEQPARAWGTTYVSDLALVIPRVIWPNRPTSPGEDFAQRSASWSAGQGQGFSPLTEAYVNFGWVGVPIQFFFFGLLWGKLWTWLRRAFFRRRVFYWRTIYFTFGFSLLTLMHRNSIGSLNAIVHIVTPLVLFATVFDRRRRKEARMAPGQTTEGLVGSNDNR